ncbi:hypothetical protein K8R43_03705 [archaeon]|nr:hypothetical protein [archaeon]
MVFWDLETKRQMIHLCSGLCFAIILFLLAQNDPLRGPDQGFMFLLGGAALTLLISLEISDGRKVPLFYWIVRHTERENDAPGKGVTWYFFGVLITYGVFYYVFHVNQVLIIASMLVLAIGDSVCTGIGRKIGRRLLPKTETKSWAGSGLGFILSAIAAPLPLMTIFPLGESVIVGFIGAGFGMLIEAYLRRFNDNLTIPIAACAAMTIASYLLGLPVFYA